MTLQQILALKLFGFDLKCIKDLIQGGLNVFDHFHSQNEWIDQQISSLKAASGTLDVILSEHNANKSVFWKNVMKLIEEYQTTKKLKHAWIAKALDPAQIKEYASFQQALDARFTPEESTLSRQKCLELVDEVGAHLDKDPSSDWGMAQGKRCME